MKEREEVVVEGECRGRRGEGGGREDGGEKQPYLLTIFTNDLPNDLQQISQT